MSVRGNTGDSSQEPPSPATVYPGETASFPSFGAATPVPPRVRHFSLPRTGLAVWLGFEFPGPDSWWSLQTLLLGSQGLHKRGCRRGKKVDFSRGAYGRPHGPTAFAPRVGLPSFLSRPAGPAGGTFSFSGFLPNEHAQRPRGCVLGFQARGRMRPLAEGARGIERPPSPARGRRRAVAPGLHAPQLLPPLARPVRPQRRLGTGGPVSPDRTGTRCRVSTIRMFTGFIAIFIITIAFIIFFIIVFISRPFCDSPRRSFKGRRLREAFPSCFI